MLNFMQIHIRAELLSNTKVRYHTLCYYSPQSICK